VGSSGGFHPDTVALSGAGFEPGGHQLARRPLEPAVIRRGRGLKVVGMRDRVHPHLREGHTDSSAVPTGLSCAAASDGGRVFTSYNRISTPAAKTTQKKALQRRRVLSRLVATTLLLTVVTVGTWLEREFLLRGAADLWIVSDPVIARADAVAVLGGGLETRPFAAAEFYQKGLVAKILVSQVADGRLTSIGVLPGHSELNRNVLRKLGVPDAAIEMFGEANGNTRDEAIALREWADHHRASAIVVPTEIFSARRVRWIFNHEFAESSARLKITAVPVGYTREDWWKSEAGLIAFQNEVMKYIYYRLKY
jgi:hypothetical protein